jgi:2-dehydropantoate 2-reductase
MRACVLGAGAVGGQVAVRLADTGNTVTVLARGETAAAIVSKGLKLITPAGETTARVKVCTDAAEAGPQDVVFVAVKSMSIPGATDSILKLKRPVTSFVFILNGIPWWYPYGHRPTKVPLPDLDYLDAGGRLAKGLAIEQVLGSVVYSGNEVLEPGVVRNHSAAGNSIVSVGDPSGRSAARVEGVRKLLEEAGFKSPAIPDMRTAVWTKLIASNLASFPICTLLNAPLTVFAGNPELVEAGRAILREGIAVANAYGIDPGVDPVKIYDATKPGTPHRPSMVQDFARGKPLEIDGVLVAAQKFARAAGVPMPSFDALMAILMQRAVEAGLYKKD